MEDKIRLGGMALVNGVLVHGPSSWACAIRTPDGELKVASDYKRLQATRVRNPLLRGPAKMAEVFALLPQVRRRLPEALRDDYVREVVARCGEPFQLDYVRLNIDARRPA